MDLGRLVKIFVRHKNAANLLMLMMIVIGIASIYRLNTQFFPDFGTEVITTSIVWPGASAEDVDSNITTAILPEVRFLNGVKRVTSYSVEGSSVIVVEFEPETDMQAALSDVEQGVTQITTFPETIETPNVKRVVIYDPIARLSVSGPYSEDALKRIAKTMRDDLLDLGIDKITLFGARNEEIWVDVERRDLRRLNLSLTDIAGIIRNNSQDVPLGTVSGTYERQLRSLEQKTNAKSLGALEIKSFDDGQKIYLRDIADVQDEFSENGSTGWHKGSAAIEISIQRAQSTDALKAEKIVSGYFEREKERWPPELEIKQYDVQAKLIEDRIRLLINNGASGLILVLIILFIFLNVRVAFWVAAGIPVAILATAGVMLLTGQSINMISLFAIIMSLGIIVDDAIVVGEHASYLRSTGLSAVDAAERGALRMLAPVFASSLTTIAAFLPIFLIGDVIGQIIRAIPAVVVSVLIASLIECFLILPGHMRHALRYQGNSTSGLRRSFDEKFSYFQTHQFRRVVELTVNWRYATLAAAVAMLIISVGFFLGGRIGFNFFPSPEANVVNANVVFAPGSVRSDTEAMVKELERALYKAENDLTDGDGGLIVMSLGKIGISTGDQFSSVAGDNRGGMMVELISSDLRNVRTADFVTTWRKEIREMPGIQRIALTERIGGPPGRELDIRLKGDNVDALKSAAEEVKELLKQFRGVSDIEDDLPVGKQEIILELTPRGRALGFTTEDIATQVRAGFEGVIARKFARGDEEVTIRVQLPRDQIAAEALRDFYLKSASGLEVPLSAVVTERTQVGFARIKREDGVREVAITAEIDENLTSSDQVLFALPEEGLEAISAAYDLKYRFAGKSEEQADTIADMKFGATIGLSAIYLILAWVFSSYWRPVVVMSIIPFGLVGAILGHYALGYNLTILSLIALLGLSGILVNNSIILVSVIDERLSKGEAYIEAVIGGTCDRLRAVLLTSLTTIGGLTPLLFETSLQAQFLIPMAITLVFGLMAATFLVLFLVPALLIMQDDFGRMARGLKALYFPNAGKGKV
ncbi:efflux RND transporter permease subunit [Sneathiella litorea]|uniref:AcrB/AcrD/AcrF family protein n=1 Tax=Sneathiella litorea TaxID=2606216 RepID=A0A6L8W4H6_9PROT|nr:efflux RND transporter permease subunit [Sneathiella litorea]MZR29995.1 AcrB/AcrD/AcrF family protein [Sneathiella litorea]